MIKKILGSKESKKESKYVTVPINNNFKDNSLDDEFWLFCTKCKKHIFKKDIEDNLNVCPKCNSHYKLEARDRINLLVEKDSFVELYPDLSSNNIINFPDYDDKLNKYKDKTNENEAVIIGYGYINNIKICLGVMNPNFMMGSMGSVVGDKITYLIEYAANENLPLILCTASGGARMQEGMVSLMQMIKTSQAINKLSEKSLPYISILTDPTTGGVSASFAMLGDIIISEPNTLIAFAGKRVIEQTIKQKLPEGFQTSEFLLEHGFIDLIVNRQDMKEKLYDLLSMHNLNIEAELSLEGGH